MFHPDTGDYEFSEEQNAVIRKLSNAMTVFASFSLAWGALLVKRAVELTQVHSAMTGELFQNSLNKTDVTIAVIQSYLGALVPLLFGFFMVKAAAHFRKIVKTEGSDIPNLLTALGSLNSVYMVGIVLAVILLLLLVSNVIALRAFL